MDIGLIAFAFAGFSLIFIPWLDRSDVVAPAHENRSFFIWFWVLMIDLILLTIYGKLPADGVTRNFNNFTGFVLSILYIGLLLIALPLITIVERKRGKNERVKDSCYFDHNGRCDILGD